MKRRRSWAAAALLLLGGFWALAGAGDMNGLAGLGVALAAEPDEPFQVDYQAPSGCPDERGFAAEITGRTNRARRARPNEPSRTLHVRIEGAGGSFTGRLRILDANGQATSERTVRGAACAEVVSALGLSSALAIDPRASASVAVADAAPTTAPVSSGASGASGASDAGVDGSEVSFAATRSPPVVSTRPGATTTAAPPARALQIGIGGAAEVQSNFSGTALFGGHVATRLEPTESRAVFAPELRLRVSRSLERTLSATGASGVVSGTFLLTSFVLEACPLRFFHLGPLATRACTRGSMTLVDARGEGNVLNATSRQRPLFDVGVTIREDWRLSRYLELALQADLRLPLLRDRFTVGSSADLTTIYDIPPVVFAGLATGTVYFP